MGFSIGYPDIDDIDPKKDQFTAKIYFKTQIIRRKSDRSFKFEDLFAAIGGFVGIFVGLSIMDAITAFKRSVQVIPTQIRKITKSELPKKENP